MADPEVTPETPAAPEPAPAPAPAPATVPEVIPEASLAAFDTYVPPACAACGKSTTLRVACPECGHSHEMSDQLFKRLDAVPHK